MMSDHERQKRLGEPAPSLNIAPHLLSPPPIETVDNLKRYHIAVLVGRNGCSKSTELSRLHRFFDTKIAFDKTLRPEKETEKKDASKSWHYHIYAEREGEAYYEKDRMGGGELRALIPKLPLRAENGEERITSFHFSGEETSISRHPSFNYLTLVDFFDLLNEIPKEKVGAIQKELQAVMRCMSIDIQVNPQGLEISGGMLPKPLFFKNLKLSFDHRGARFSSSLSTGSKQLLFLSIRTLTFFYRYDLVKADPAIPHTGILTIDEPETHLHPDAQEAYVKFVANQIHSRGRESTLKVVFATHSTAILSTLNHIGLEVGIKLLKPPTLTSDYKPAPLEFIPLQEKLSFLLPVLGAHPLSRLFRQGPLLLVEGPDDEWVWKNVKAQHQGSDLHPHPIGSVSNAPEIVTLTNQIVRSLYDAPPPTFMVLDQDSPSNSNKLDRSIYEKLERAGFVNADGTVNNCVKIFKLQCYAIENLCYTDEFLAYHNTSWEEMKTKSGPEDRFRLLKGTQLRDDRFLGNRSKKTHSVIINHLHYIQLYDSATNLPMESKGPTTEPKVLAWQVALARVIKSTISSIKNAHLKDIKPATDHSIIKYLGSEILKEIFEIPTEKLEKLFPQGAENLPDRKHRAKQRGWRPHKGESKEIEPVTRTHKRQEPIQAVFGPRHDALTRQPPPDHNPHPMG